MFWYSSIASITVVEIAYLGRWVSAICLSFSKSRRQLGRLGFGLALDQYPGMVMRISTCEAAL
jgi:hypothetical protein